MDFTVELQIMPHACCASPKLNQVHSREDESLFELVSMDRLPARWEDKLAYFPKVFSWAQLGYDWLAKYSFELRHNLSYFAACNSYLYMS